jgi:SAM-dependent methyltransferase
MRTTTAPTCACESTSYRTVLTGRFNRLGLSEFPFEIARCTVCGLARTLPVPDPEQYAEGWALSTDEGRFVGRLEDGWSDSIARTIAREVAQRRPVAGARFLDVGCHVGNLVVAAGRIGFAAEGVDVDHVAVAEARRLGRNVRLGSAADVDGLYDVVVLNHVLEHIHDLDAFLADVARLIAPTGILFVFVPYHRGLVPRLMRESWMGWSPAQHVWHFTPRTLGAAAERNGLRLVRATTNRVHEPVSAGAKGAAKAVIARTSRVVGRGDLLEAVLEPSGDRR